MSVAPIEALLLPAAFIECSNDFRDWTMKASKNPFHSCMKARHLAAAAPKSRQVSTPVCAAEQLWPPAGQFELYSEETSALSTYIVSRFA